MFAGLGAVNQGARGDSERSHFGNRTRYSLSSRLDPPSVLVCVPPSMSSMSKRAVHSHPYTSHSLVAQWARERTAQSVKSVKAPISDAKWS